MSTQSTATEIAAPWWRSFNRHHWFVFTVASLAWLFDCLDQQVFNLSRDGAVEDLIGNKAKAIEFAPYTTSVFLVGWAVGGLIFGSLGDRYGRARMLAVTMLIYSLCTGLCAFATSFAAFCACLFLTGLGVGGVFGLSVALVRGIVLPLPRHIPPYLRVGLRTPPWEVCPALNQLASRA